MIAGQCAARGHSPAGGAVNGVRGGSTEGTAEAERAATREAFARIVAAYEAPISRYLSRLVGDLELARDLTQDTFLAAYRALPRTEVTDMGGWLYRIATNQALAHFRRQRLVSWVPLSRLLGKGRDPAVAGHGERVAMEASVAAALARLDPRDRACLLLAAAGFSGEEIAGQLGCSVGAARTRLSRARATFRRLYHGDAQVEGR